VTCLSAMALLSLDPAPMGPARVGSPDGYVGVARSGWACGGLRRCRSRGSLDRPGGLLVDRDRLELLGLWQHLGDGVAIHRRDQHEDAGGARRDDAGELRL